MIYVTGDVYGDGMISRLVEFREIEKKLNVDDYLIICGDLGIIQNNDTSEKKLLDYLENKPYTICFVEGEHDNLDLINSNFQIVDFNEGEAHKIKKNIYHLIKGQIYKIEGKTIFTMGGAYGVTNTRRILHSKWTSNIPTDRDYSTAMKNIENYDYSVDYIISHIPPREVLYKLGLSPDEREKEIATFLEYIMYSVEYKHFFCGHLHRDYNFSNNLTILWQKYYVI